MIWTILLVLQLLIDADAMPPFWCLFWWWYFNIVNGTITVIHQYWYAAAFISFAIDAFRFSPFLRYFHIDIDDIADISPHYADTPLLIMMLITLLMISPRHYFFLSFWSSFMIISIDFRWCPLWCRRRHFSLSPLIFSFAIDAWYCWCYQPLSFFRHWLIIMLMPFDIIYYADISAD